MKALDIQLAVLDMAGTTTRDDDAVNRCLRQTLLSGGMSVSRDEANEVMGIPKPVAISMLMERKHNGTRPSAETVARLHDDFLRRMLEFYRTDPSVEPTVGATDALGELRDAGIMVALDTGFSRDIADAVLDRLGWRESQLVNFTVASDEVPRGRPYPDMIFEAMRQAGVRNAEHVAKVGDTPADLQEGHAAGCSLVVGVTNGTHTREQLAQHPHTHLIDTLRELPGIIFGRYTLSS
jgi:phosphonatase-like hydrolase